MTKQNEQSIQNNDRHDKRRDNPQLPQQKNAPRRNPRLVFVDPDKFFRELLMEQQEQS